MAWLPASLAASGLLALASLLEFCLWWLSILTSPSRLYHGAVFGAVLVYSGTQVVLSALSPSAVMTRLAQWSYGMLAWAVPWLFQQAWFIKPLVMLDDTLRIFIDRVLGPLLIWWVVMESKTTANERLRDPSLAHGNPLDTPSDILAMIISRLDPTSRRALRLTSRQLYAAVNLQVMSCTLSEANMCLAISLPLPRVFPRLERLIITLDPATFVTMYKANVYSMYERAMGRVNRSFAERVTAGVVSLDHNIFLHHLFVTVLPALPHLRVVDLGGVSSLFPHSWHAFVGACPAGSCTVRLNPRGLPQPPLPAIVSHGLRSLCPQHLADIALLVQSRPSVRIEAVKDGFVHCGMAHWGALAALPQLHSAVATLRSADCDALLGDEVAAALMLPRLGALLHLRMPSITVPASQLGALCAAPHLHTLELGVINDPLQYAALALLPSLTDLSVGLLFVPQGARALAALTRLTVTRMTCTDPHIRTVFPNLKAMITAGRGFAAQRWGGDQRGQAFHGLSGHTAVQELSLSCGSDLWTVPPSESPKLCTLVGLRKLCLWGPYKSQQLKTLLMEAKTLPALDHLELHNLQGVMWNNGGEAKEEPLLAHPRLARSLGQHLQGLRGLRTLVLDDSCAFTLLRRAAGPPSLPRSSPLQEVHLSNIAELFDGDLIFAATALPNLQQLSVSGCRRVELEDVLLLPRRASRPQLDVQWSFV